jgi:hypothetical protein
VRAQDFSIGSAGANNVAVRDPDLVKRDRFWPPQKRRWSDYRRLVNLTSARRIASGKSDFSLGGKENGRVARLGRAWVTNGKRFSLALGATLN